MPVMLVMLSLLRGQSLFSILTPISVRFACFTRVEYVAHVWTFTGCLWFYFAFLSCAQLVISSAWHPATCQLL